MLAEQMAPLHVSQAILMGTAIMMTLPRLMIVLCVTLKPFIARWLNVIVATAFTIIEMVVISGRHWIFCGCSRSRRGAGGVHRMGRDSVASTEKLVDTRLQLER